MEKRWNAAKGWVGGPVVANFRAELDPLGGVVIGSNRGGEVTGLRDAEAARIALAVGVVVILQAAGQVPALVKVDAVIGIHVIGTFDIPWRRRSAEDRALG